MADVRFAPESGQIADCLGRSALCQQRTLPHSPNEWLWNVTRDHSALIPANLITLTHFSVSSAMSLPKSEGETTSGVPPKSAKPCLRLGVG